MYKRPKVVVVGGGISGVTAALNLAQRDSDVVLVERDSVLGGNALSVCCKAVDGKCQYCGGCLLADRLADVQKLANIERLLQTTVTRVQRDNGGFGVSLAHTSAPDVTLSPKPLFADALVIATGFDHIDARSKGPYGYGLVPAVTTGYDVERRIKEQGQEAYVSLNPRKVAFIQCVGSRDEHYGRGYCSQVCCRYAVRLAMLFRSQFPKSELSVFKMDIQTCGRDFSATYQAALGKGIRFVSGLPAIIRRSADDSQRATFLYDDILAGKTVQEDFDLVVLAVGMEPRRDAAEVANLVGINQDEYGFFGAQSDGTRTLVPGVFLAGSCQSPRSIAESIAHAQQAAEACYSYVQEKGS